MSGLQSLHELLRQSHHARPEDLPAMAMRAAPLLGAVEAVIYLVDPHRRELIPLLSRSAPHRETILIEGTLAGLAYTRVATQTSDDPAGGTRLWLPMMNGSERLGVLEIVSDGPLDDQTRDECASVASLLGELTVTRSLYSDTIERTRRRQPMHLAAEMLRTQLPPLTFSTGHLVISGILEPCYDVGGDAFDYAVNGDTAHLALFDATGHGSAGGLRSVVLASIALAAYRNARRAGFGMVETYHHIDDAVRSHDTYGMITAVLAELDQVTGVLRVISAGHPGGLVLRAGRVVKALPSPTAMPITLGDQSAPVVVEEALEPGDRVLLYTDGITEARAADGTQFGLDRLTDYAIRAEADQLPPPETTRRLVQAILDFQNDKLQDDATILLAEWRSPAPADAGTGPPTAPDHRPLDVET